MESLLLAEPDTPEPPRPAPAPPERLPAADELLHRIETSPPAGEPVEEVPTEPGLFAAEEKADAVAAILADMAAEPDCTFQPVAALFQDFTLRCRMARLVGHGLDAAAFRRRFALAVAGARPGTAQWDEILALAEGLADDLLAPFLLIARAAQTGAPCPDETELSRVYGTRSPGRIRRLLDHFEKAGLIVVRTDFGGRRSIGVPALGATTASVD